VYCLTPIANACSSLYHTRIVPPACAIVGSNLFSTVLSLNVVAVLVPEAPYGYAWFVNGLPRKHEAGITLSVSLAEQAPVPALKLRAFGGPSGPQLSPGLVVPIGGRDGRRVRDLPESRI
jgi:hypothetical protein